MWVDPDRRKMGIVTGIFMFYLGALALAMSYCVCYSNPKTSKEGVVLISIMLALCLGVTWFFFGFFFFRLFFDRFAFKKDHYEVRLLRKGGSVDIPQNEVFAFGQGMTGTIGLFKRDGTVLAALPLPLLMKKEFFLLTMRHRLIHRGLIEIPTDVADKLLFKAKKR